MLRDATLFKYYLDKEEQEIKNKLDIHYTVYDNGYYIGPPSNLYMILVKSINKDIDSILIHSNCVYINHCAMKDCKNLEYIVIPESVKYVGEFSFDGCSNLRIVEVLSEFTKFNYECFKGCTKLKKNVIYNGKRYYNMGLFTLTNDEIIKETIYDNAYYIGTKDNPYLVLIKPVNENISSIILHKDCLILSNLAFCDRLKDVKLNDKLLLIDFGAFMCCTSITNINLPSSLTKMESHVFDECYNLESITIPDNIHIIREYTFSCCYKLKKIIIKSKDYIVEDNAFDS